MSLSNDPDQRQTGADSSSSSLTETEAIELLNLLEHEINEILKTPNYAISPGHYMKLYSSAYNLYQHGYGEKLYLIMKDVFHEHVMSLRGQVDQSSNVLETINPVWAHYSHAMDTVEGILQYLNRKLNELGPGFLPIKVLLLEAFRKELLENGIGAKLRKEMLGMIEKAREGNEINSEPINNVCNMLIALGTDSRKYYEDEFEQFLLKETTDYYQNLSKKLVSGDSAFDVANYLAKMEDVKKSEANRVSQYFDEPTQVKVLKVIEAVIVEATRPQ